MYVVRKGEMVEWLLEWLAPFKQQYFKGIVSQDWGGLTFSKQVNQPLVYPLNKT